MNRMEHDSWIRKNRWKAVFNFNFLLVSYSPWVDITNVPEESPDLLKGEAKGMGIGGFHLCPVHVLVIQTQCEDNIRLRNISQSLKT